MKLDEDGRWPWWAAIINAVLLSAFLWAAIFAVIHFIFN